MTETAGTELSRHLKGPMRGGPPSKVTNALVEELSGATVLTAAPLFTVSMATVRGAVALTTDQLVVAQATKTEVTMTRIPLGSVAVVARWAAIVGTETKATALLVLVPTEPPIAIYLAPRDADRFAERLPQTLDNAFAIDAKVLVTPHGVIPVDALVTVAILGEGIHAQQRARPWSSHFVPRAEITRFSVDGVDQVQLRPSVIAVVAFGVLGLAARRQEKRSYLVVEAVAGDTVYEVDGLLPTELRARVSPHLKPVSESAPTGGLVADRSVDPVERLKQVAELHAAGALSDQEFASTKDALLQRIQGGE